MRIVYLHQYFTTPQMAGGTRSYEMARRLVARGHEVRVVAADCSGRGRGWSVTEEAGVEVHWCPVAYSNRMTFPRRLGSFVQFARRAAGKAASLPGDVVFASSTPLTIALPAVRAARRKRVPMVFEVRDLWPEMPIAVGAIKSRGAIAAARWLERFAYRNAARVVALSPGMRDGVVATGYPADRVSVIPNSCDFALFDVDRSAGREFRRRHAWLGERPLVVYAGALGMINGVDYLARVAAAAARVDPRVCFLTVGTGREEEKVRRAAVELGVWEKNFFMLPALPKADMAAVLSAADLATSLFLDIPQMWSNSANKVFDALAAGRPIAINHQGWLAEMIHETGCGLVLDPHDPEEAASRVLAAVGDPVWLAAAGQAARRVGRERFDRDKLTARLEEVLVETVVGNTRQRLAA